MAYKCRRGKIRGKHSTPFLPGTALMLAALKIPTVRIIIPGTIERRPGQPGHSVIVNNGQITITLWKGGWKQTIRLFTTDAQATLRQLKLA